MGILSSLFSLLIFPGFLFLMILAFLFEWFDRKLLARFERRVGPRLFQPLADLIKLCGKEDLFPKGSNQLAVTALPLISLASVLTAGMYIPIASYSAFSFEGDLIVVLFLLSVPTLSYYLAGAVSIGIYSILGGARSLLQYFSYEVPLIIAVSGPAILSGSWSVREIMHSQSALGPFFVYQPVGFLLAIVGLIGKLKRDPLDIPKAKSEVVAGPLTEYSGVKLGIWHTLINMQAVLGIFLLISLFLSWGNQLGTLVSILVFTLQSVLMVVLLSAASSIFARIRIDQLANLGWRVLVPLGILQLFVTILMRA